MKQWYMLAYDIRNPKRLKKMHYFLSKKGFALQNSVFIFKADNKALNELLDDIKQRVHKREDDIRLYPIVHPNAIWAAGKQADVMAGLYGSNKPKQRKKGFAAWIKTLFTKDEA